MRFQFHKTTKKGEKTQERYIKFTEVLWAVELGVASMFYFEGVFFILNFLLKYVLIIKIRKKEFCNYQFMATS